MPAAATPLQITEDKVWSEFLTAVYIAADVENTIRYVGSIVRAGTSRIGDRVQEHVVTERAARWIRLMVVPLIPDTEEVLVRRFEGRIGAVLRPLDTVRLPSTWQAPTTHTMEGAAVPRLSTARQPAVGRSRWGSVLPVATGHLGFGGWAFAMAPRLEGVFPVAPSGGVT